MTLPGNPRIHLVTLAFPALVMGLAGCRGEGDLLGHTGGAAAIAAPAVDLVEARLGPAPTGSQWDYAGSTRIEVTPGRGDATSSALEFRAAITPGRAREFSKRLGLSRGLGRAFLELLDRAKAVRELARTGALDVAGLEPRLHGIPRDLLEPGASWVIRSDPFYAVEVEALERITVAAGRFPACRLRLTGESLGPDDRVLLWYGGPGLLRLSVHAETVSATGRLILDQLEELALPSLTPRPEQPPRP